MKYKFTKGDSYQSDPDGDYCAEAGIHVETNGDMHGNRIAVYGETVESAEALRDVIFESLESKSLLIEIDSIMKEHQNEKG